MPAYNLLKALSLGLCALGCVSAGGKLEDPDTIMFAAKMKGHGKAKLMSILGLQRMKQICDELGEGGEFKCVRVFGTGAVGQLIGGNNEEWLPDELKRIVKKSKIQGAAPIEWQVAEDTEMLHQTGRKRKGGNPRTKHSWFTHEEAVELFKGGKYPGMKDSNRFARNRKLAAAQDAAAGPPGGAVLQHAAPLPLGILSSRAGDCDELCHSPTTYQYRSAGKGVTVYIVDGAVVDHEEFKDMETGVSRVSEDRHYSESARETSSQSCAGGHGTHVGSLAAGIESGAGKEATIVSVAVQPGCGGAGKASELVEGLDWILDRHLAQPEPRQPAVVSMSLLVKARTSAADLIAEKVEELIEAGIIVAAAAGNYQDEACDFVPAGLPGVITVAAADVMPTGIHAYPWTWSNYGQCVDLWAPGVDIEGAAPECFECTAIYSGTSQATPLVTGLIASHLAENPTADAEDVKTALQGAAIENLLEVLGHPYDTTPKHFAQITIDPTQ